MQLVHERVNDNFIVRLVPHEIYQVMPPQLISLASGGDPGYL